MNRTRLLAWALAAAASAAVLLLALRGAGFWRPSAAADVLPVPPGDQEIAWIETADGKDSWQDFVTGALDAKEGLCSPDWPGYDVGTKDSSKEETTAVPEISLGVTA